MRDDQGVCGGDRRFEAGSVEEMRSRGRPAALGKRFRPFDPHKVLPAAASVVGRPAARGPLARFVADLVDEVLDLSPVLADYGSDTSDEYSVRLFANRGFLLEDQTRPDQADSRKYAEDHGTPHAPCQAS
ncbi:hypothetical protein [Streptomyces sp. NPDC093260]|uniref:hypothetical protein n=1 Tax=Streptomyces sp. NPDC093260 TaxID=3155073 RepID=UPI0034281231